MTSNPDAAEARAGLRELTVLPAGDMIPASQLDASVDGQLTMMRSPWGRYFPTFDPRTTLAQVKCPVLAIGGSLDQALQPRENLRQVHDTLRVAGNPDATVIELFGVNHLLQTARTGAPDEILRIEETMSPRVLSLITNWLRERGERRGSTSH